jgi:hypothetical protein
MLNKTTLLFLAFCLYLSSSKAQENRLLISYTNKTTKSIRKGDNVRLSYPTAKLDIKKTNKTPRILGFRGKIDSISGKDIWLQTDKKSSKRKILAIKDIIAIKKASGSEAFCTFLATYAIIGTSSALIVNSLDVNPAATTFAGVFALFPAAIITANVFYPTKPRQKIGPGYSIKVITIN